MKTTYDFLIAGGGLFGSVFAQKAVEAGKKCLVLERRPHIGGNVYTEETEGIQVHKYGPHIFHTSNSGIWEYINRFAAFNNFINSPLANYKGRIFNLPFNMNTFNRMWGVTSPAEAREMIERSRSAEYTESPKNLEQMAINLVGREIYETLIKGYTEKQWGRRCEDLPPSIITRLPVRFTFDNNYFNDRYQGVPIGGYAAMIEKLLEGAEVRLNEDYLKDKPAYDKLAEHVVFTGSVDAYFDYRFGELEYRSVCFETETLDTDNYQGVAVMNYTDKETPFTRVIEHKHFDPVNRPRTVISREFSKEWEPGAEPFYPVENARSVALYRKYAALAEREEAVTFGGRLGTFRYYDMDKVVEQALLCAAKLLAP
ncbi:MAG: UDP-galactopyranose mutase [Clostridiales bacterium]|nr:UDP-galactopyranose mutase [Clostridiales bacterium]